MSVPVFTGKNSESPQLHEAITLLERSYEEIINLEIDEEDPIFSESRKSATQLSHEVCHPHLIGLLLRKA